MPNAAATTFLDDFGTAEPRRRAAPRKARPTPSKGRKGGKGRRARVDMGKVARLAAIGMTATVLGGIVVNALMMQNSRHPAPLFSHSIALPRQAATPPLAPAKTAPPPATPAPAQPVQSPAAAKARHAAAPDKDAGDKGAGDRGASDDAIARLLNGGAQAKADGKGEAKAEGRTVLGVQRALAKLGFTVKPSGTFGPQTRKAIEAFEKDHHLPVKGEVSPRLVKVLAAESGVKVD